MNKKTKGIIEIVMGVLMLVIAWYVNCQLYRYTGIEEVTYGADFYTDIYFAVGTVTHQMVDLFDMISDCFSVVFAFFGVKEILKGIEDRAEGIAKKEI